MTELRLLYGRVNYPYSTAPSKTLISWYLFTDADAVFAVMSPDFTGSDRVEYYLKDNW